MTCTGQLKTSGTMRSLTFDLCFGFMSSIFHAHYIIEVLKITQQLQKMTISLIFNVYMSFTSHGKCYRGISERRLRKTSLALDSL